MDCFNNELARRQGDFDEALSKALSGVKDIVEADNLVRGNRSKQVLASHGYPVEFPWTHAGWYLTDGTGPMGWVPDWIESIEG